MDERLKPLMQRLGDAINESLSESESIAKVIGDIKRVGYDVFLVLEVTIVYNKRDGKEETRNAPTTNKITVDFKFSPQDKKLLELMHITTDDDNERSPKEPPKQLPLPKKPSKDKPS